MSGSRLREQIGATDRIPEERLHTNDEQILDLAFARLDVIGKLTGRSRYGR